MKLSGAKVREWSAKRPDAVANGLSVAGEARVLSRLRSLLPCRVHGCSLQDEVAQLLAPVRPPGQNGLGAHGWPR